MTPEYLYQLADIADPDQLWKLNPFDQIKLSESDKAKLYTGIALRRHATHIQRLLDLLGTGKSLVITPIRSNSSASMLIDAPENHRKLLNIGV